MNQLAVLSSLCDCTTEPEPVNLHTQFSFNFFSFNNYNPQMQPQLDHQGNAIKKVRRPTTICYSSIYIYNMYHIRTLSNPPTTSTNTTSQLLSLSVSDDFNSVWAVLDRTINGDVMLPYQQPTGSDETKTGLVPFGKSSTGSYFLSHTHLPPRVLRISLR